jgi:hypothetical protein
MYVVPANIDSESLAVGSAEHRRMADYDSRLRRPQLVPAIARFLFRVTPTNM